MYHSANQSATLPLWLNPAYAKHIVRGNFTTLGVRPTTVEQGEWVAYQAVEHYRILWNFVRVIQEKEVDGDSICNPATCPRMSAGSHLFTWLTEDQEPAELPACECIRLLEQWMSTKIDDEEVLPTDQSGVSYAHNFMYSPNIRASIDWLGSRSGFPERFAATCKVIFRQMFQVSAHLYWSHFVDPFYHLHLEKHLNSCFSHFLLTETTLGMLHRHEVEPMQDLVNLWAADGTFPVHSKVY